MRVTRRPSRRPVATAVLCIALASAAACGSGDDDDSSAAADDTESSTVAGENAATSDTDSSATSDSAGSASDVTADSPAATAGSAATGAGGKAPQVDEACQQQTLDELVPAANEEGKVTVYSSQGDEELNSLAAAFEEKYPEIDVEIVRDVDSTAIARVETEMQTGSMTADFLVTAAPGWEAQRAPEEWFVEPTGPQFACASEYDAESYIHDGNYFEVSAVVFGYAWNTDAYPNGIDSYDGLLDPELADGKIGVVDPAISPVLADFYQWLDESYGDGNFLEQFAEQSPRIYTSGGANQEAVISGEIMVSAYIAPVPTFDNAIADGAPVEYGVPDQPWGAKFYGNILEGAPHPNATQLFADYMVTAEGQALIHSGGTVLPNIPRALTTVDRVRDIDLETQEPENVTAFVNEWNSLFR